MAKLSGLPETIDIPLNQDDRGFVYCAMDLMDQKGIKRTYVVENFNRGQIRAWHGHMKAGTYMHVINGSCKLIARPINSEIGSDDWTRVCSDRKPQLFYVPPGYYNGALSLTDGTKILVYSTLSFDEVKNDDVRLPWDAAPFAWEIKNR